MILVGCAGSAPVDGELAHRVLQLMFQRAFVFEAAEQRWASASGWYAVGRNAVVLLGDVGQVEELAEWARATGSSSSLDKFCRVESSSWRCASLPAREDLESFTDGLNAIENMLAQRFLMVSPSNLPSILTLLRIAEYYSFI